MSETKPYSLKKGKTMIKPKLLILSIAVMVTFVSIGCFYSADEKPEEKKVSGAGDKKKEIKEKKPVDRRVKKSMIEFFANQLRNINARLNKTKLIQNETARDSSPRQCLRM